MANHKWQITTHTFIKPGKRTPYLLCIHMPGSGLGSVSAAQSLSQSPRAHFHLYMFCTKKKSRRESQCIICAPFPLFNSWKCFLWRWILDTFNDPILRRQQYWEGWDDFFRQDLSSWLKLPRLNIRNPSVVGIQALWKNDSKNSDHVNG